MKITDIPVNIVSCPYKRVDWISSLGKAVKRDTVILQVYTDEGVTGIGETHHASAPPVIATIIEKVLKPILIGEDPFSIEKFRDRVLNSPLYSYLGSSLAIAASGVEIALWDIIGKALKLPIYKLLGGYRERVRAYAGGLILGWKDLQSLEKEAANLVDQGFTSSKIRVGQGYREDTEKSKLLETLLEIQLIY